MRNDISARESVQVLLQVGIFRRRKGVGTFWQSADGAGSPIFGTFGWGAHFFAQFFDSVEL